ncbi:proline-, glutamic acid- and leucine-rich protein 1-like [Eriocheir sinensis]|uniref:proline-, glutamic acid- and leucine-rich protein 1-like n=1 Tax=Eriocheir sinensis TaxID=95602 RepID=UPI0021CA86D7|nr:proline-, glutamic acid- and leucine-rich protein 1-like [Eriocheir sinensis]
MLNLLVHGAVPFGYAPTMNDSDYHDLHHYPYHHDSPQHHHHHLNRRDVNWQRVDYTRDQLPLPDLIPCNTPPPSPLRRTRSCHAFFPDTPPPSPHLPPTPPLTPASPRPTEGAIGATGENNQAGRQDEDPLPRVSPPLQPLSWPIPCRPRPPMAPREEASGGEEGEERQTWRRIGADLRKIADQFQVTHAKVRTKRTRKEEKKEKENQGDEDEGEEDKEDDNKREEKEEEEQVEGAVSISIPAALTRCLSASLLLLVCWRLVSK